MTDAFTISDAYVDKVFALSPMAMTEYGIDGGDHLWDDLSPAGHDAMAQLRRATREDLTDHLHDADPAQAHAATVLAAKLDEELAAHAAGDHLRDVNHIYCPVTEVRDIFDIMDRASAAGWANVTARLATLDEPLTGYRASLEAGIDRGLVPPRRQVTSVIEQMRVLAGDASPFNAYAAEAVETGLAPAAREELAAAVTSARASVAELADWFEATLLPLAPAQDGVGRDRYSRNVQAFIGDDLDLDETYAWGWQELGRIWDQMEVVAAEIDPDADVREVIQRLETDPEQAATSPQAFADAVQALQDDAVDKLDGTYFDLPDKMKQVTVNLAPAGGALGAWYINPSEDFTRPGSVWYSLGTTTTIPMWKAVSTAYHEGFPGHHLQVATVMDRTDQLSRAHRLLVWYPGYGEGWALYTERLMDELGFLDNPAWKLGMLATHAFRASRVVVDLGLHLDLPIPDDAPMFAGQRWNFDTAVEFMTIMGVESHDVAVSEVNRYLGWPAQAISYKLGERAILAIRDELQSRGGFDLNDFHNRILDGGPLRIDMLRARMLA